MPIESIPSSSAGAGSTSIQRTRKTIDTTIPQGRTSHEPGRSSQNGSKGASKTRIISLVEWGSTTKDALLSISKLLRTDIQLLAKVLLSQDNDIAEISKKGYLAQLRKQAQQSGAVMAGVHTTTATADQEITRDQVQDFLRKVTQKMNEK